MQIQTLAQNEAEELKANDRCDSCGAAAQVRATFLNGELLFCGHHARKFEDKLKSTALTIFDPNESLPVIINPNDDEGKQNDN
jgi:hypothetical protein